PAAAHGPAGARRARPAPPPPAARPPPPRAAAPPGAPRPALVVQGGRDPFGRPEEFPAPGGRHPYELVEVAHGDHGFAVPKKAATTQEEALRTITDAVGEWLARLTA
ncbi:alpha/beta family hydrolase, partial [Streptomyces erythrochromogenes]|uniref:alpha/beta family hydrolase n=1 Tax=Streptomyces erythrochromogenes TaxID=285574 RepID=UPI0036A6598E